MSLPSILYDVIAGPPGVKRVTMPTRRLFLLTAAAATRAEALAPDVGIALAAGEKLTFSHKGAKLLEHRFSSARPKTYVHPLCLADGTPVTLDGPEDHVHHRGLMVAWSEVNGIDFWGEVNPAPHGEIVHQRFERTSGGNPAVLTEVNHWIASGRVLLRERRTLRVPEPGTTGVWLDWSSEFTAHDEPVLLSAGKHTYNGLGVRVTPAMDGGAVLNARGTIAIEQANGQNAAWCAYHGGSLGIALFDHPSNPRHPNAFFVMNRPFGYLSAAPTFREPFRLATGAALRLRWGVLTFRGAPDAAAFDRQFQTWSQT